MQTTQISPSQHEINQLMSAYSEGQFLFASQLAEKMTRAFPSFVQGWTILGVSLMMTGRRQEALAVMRTTIELAPDDAQAHCNLGAALRDTGQLEASIESCKRAIAINSRHAQAHYNLGNAYQELGNLADAIDSFRRAIRIDPNYIDAHTNMGNALFDLGQIRQAAICFHRVLDLAPDSSRAHCNIGNALRQLGRIEEAIAHYQRALEIEPDYLAAHNNLGMAELEGGEAATAVNCFRRALAIAPEDPELLGNLGTALQELGSHEEAIAYFQTALKAGKDNALIYNNLANSLKEIGNLNDALATCRHALEIDPKLSGAIYNLGTIFLELQRVDEAITTFQRAFEIDSQCVSAVSGELFCLNFVASTHSLGARMQDRARAYGELLTARVRRRFTKWNCEITNDRLRVGLISGDLYSHPVGYFLEGIISELDPNRVELYAYPSSAKADPLTARIKPKFRAWQPIIKQSDEMAAELIHGDRINILLDLAGHTANHRLPVFSWKPAPIQVSWLGYFATTGVAEMDYVLADPYSAPPEEDCHFTEKIWRLPETRLCFTPPDYRIEVSPPPALKQQFVTFGCFNNLSKMNDSVVRLWSQILHKTPNSRLFLKSTQLNDPIVMESTVKRFGNYGIDPNRLMLEGSSPRREYFEAYHRVDLALDPFPYPGGTTTVEGLWMGVPVVTKRGDHFLSHQGEALLINAGLLDWIAQDDDDYVNKAVAFSNDIERLATLRAGLRKQLLSCPLFDAARFSRHFEEAMWSIWRQWESLHLHRKSSGISR